MQNTITKFSKNKNKTKKDPIKFQKIKTYIRRPQVKKLQKINLPKSGKSDYKYNFERKKIKIKTP